MMTAVAQQAAAGDHDDWKTGHQDHDELGAEHYQGNADQQAEDDQRRIALCRCRDGNRIVQAHHGVGDDDGPDRAPKRTGGLDITTVAVVSLDEFPANPEQEKTADQLEIGDLHKLIDDQNEDHPEQDGAAGADHDGRELVLLLEIAAGQRDNERVVAGKNDIDEYDLRQTGPEGWRKLESHVVTSLRSMVEV